MTQIEIKNAFKESARTLSPYRVDGWIFDATKEHVAPRGGPMPAWRYVYRIQLADTLTEGGCTVRFGGWYGLASAVSEAAKIIGGSVCLKHRIASAVRVGQACSQCAAGEREMPDYELQGKEW